MVEAIYVRGTILARIIPYSSVFFSLSGSSICFLRLLSSISLKIHHTHGWRGSRRE
jgi:hypothetical protein